MKVNWQNDVSGYFLALFSAAKQGDAREESFYPALRSFLETAATAHGKTGVQVTMLPKPTEAGNPDFRVWDGQSRIMGYIEAKAPGVNLDQAETSDQLKRYTLLDPAGGTMTFVAEAAKLAVEEYIGIGVYIKYSAKRMTPWRFTFAKEHQEEIDLMKSNFKKVFIFLVCNDDGIVCLSYSEFKKILDNQHDPIKWISATRHKRQMYAVRGSKGELDFKIGQNDFPGKIFID